MLPHDTAGSGVTTVDPGQIHKFASLLDELTGQAEGDLRAKVSRLSGDGAKMFGDYGADSTRAEGHHRELVSGARDFATTLHERLSAIAAGAHEVATRYDDLAHLNAATSSDIDSAMAAGARKAR